MILYNGKKSKEKSGEMTILDSNTIIYLSKELVKIDDVFTDDDEYAVSIITYMEVLGYEFTSQYEEDFIHKFFDILKIIYIDEHIASKVIEIKKQHKIKLPDAIICATSILNNATLYTNDIRLKNIANLKLKLLDIK